MSQRFTIIGSGTPALVVICGDENPPLEVIGPARPAPDVTWQVQPVMPLDALTGHAIGQGNGCALIEWTVARTHESAAEAQQFVRDHPGEIPCVGICVLEWELNGTLARSLGALQALTWQRNEMPGVRSVCTYRWCGSLFIPASLGGN
jgi:hypothetical protein